MLVIPCCPRVFSGLTLKLLQIQPDKEIIVVWRFLHHFDYFSRVSHRYTTPHVPYDVLYYVSMLIGC